MLCRCQPPWMRIKLTFLVNLVLFPIISFVMQYMVVPCQCSHDNGLKLVVLLELNNGTKKGMDVVDYLLGVKV